MIITNELGTPAVNTVHNCDALRLPFEDRYVKADDAPLTDLPLFAIRTV